MRQWWLWAIVGAGALFSWWAFFEQIVGGRPFGAKPAPDWVVWLIVIGIGVLVPLLLLRTRLIVAVNERALRFRYPPFLKERAIPFADIEHHEAVTFRPLTEYGGWGWRWAGKRGWAFTTRGNQGVRVLLKSGKRILLGSQRARELARAIAEGRASATAA